MTGVAKEQPVEPVTYLVRKKADHHAPVKIVNGNDYRKLEVTDSMQQ
jgi:hypothetical protein